MNKKTSRRMSKKTNKHYPVFCKVCFDAGKPEEVFTSHFLRESREPGAKIICRTLLETVCKYCKETGHTPNHCHKLKMRKQGRPHTHHKHRVSTPDQTPETEEYNTSAAHFPTLSSEGKLYFAKKTRGTRRRTSDLKWRETVSKNAHKKISRVIFKRRKDDTDSEEELEHEAFSAPETTSVGEPEQPVMATHDDGVQAQTEPTPVETKKKSKKVSVAVAVDSFW